MSDIFDLSIQEEIYEELCHPQADDPITILQYIWELIGQPTTYRYFDNKGEWVVYPQEG